MYHYVKFIIVAVVFGFSGSVSGYTLGLQYAGLETAKIYNKRDSYFPEYNTVNGTGIDERWDHHIALLMNYNILASRTNRMYFNPIVNGNSTNRQYREVSLDFEIGLSHKGLDLYWQHESRHHLEGMFVDKFPLWDAYGIRWCMYGC